MKKILFVCTGNTCRSPMAEGIFNSLAKEYHVDAVAESAGFDTEDGLPASENAIKACSEIGVDISNHKSKKFDECNLDEYIKFLTMNFDHANILIDKGIPWSKIEVLCGADHCLCGLWHVGAADRTASASAGEVVVGTGDCRCHWQSH